MTGKKESEETLYSLGRKVDGVLEMLGSFMKATDKRFNDVDKRFDAVDKKFLAIDKKFDGIDKKCIAINNRIDSIDERLVEVRQRLGKVEVTVLDMQDDLRGALSAIDKDSIKILDHEKRVRRLEKAYR